MAKSIFRRKFVGGSSGASKNSPGTAMLSTEKVNNQNLLQELYGDPGELEEDVVPNPVQLDELAVRTSKNDGNIQSSRWTAGGNWWW